MERKAFLTTILLLVVLPVAAFFLGRYTEIFSSQLKFLDRSEKNRNIQLFSEHGGKVKFNGTFYEITFPSDWVFEGPVEGPVTGFPEFSKITSPSGDMNIYIGLRGDNRFEFKSEDVNSHIQGAVVRVGGKNYNGEEEFLDITDDPEYNVATLEVELTDINDLGYSNYSKQVLLPVKIQLLYRFSQDPSLTFEQKIELYKKEKEEALKILQNLNFTRNK